MENRHGMPIYVEIHKGHRRGDLNFGVMTGLIEDFTVEQMNELRVMFSCVIGICENAFSQGASKRHPCAMAVETKRQEGGEPAIPKQ